MAASTVSLCLVACLLLMCACVGVAHRGHPHLSSRLVVPMVCAGEPPTEPPCPEPASLPEGFGGAAEGVHGQLFARKYPSGKISVSINIEGLPPGQVLTAWAIFGVGASQDARFWGDFDPVFLVGTAQDPNNSTASEAVPLANPNSPFCFGLCQEPNEFVYSGGRGRVRGHSQRRAGRYSLRINDLGWDFLEPNQAPLMNFRSPTSQAFEAETNPAFQPTFSRLGNPLYQAVGRMYLREFGPNGHQVLGADGRPKLLRSPVAPQFIVVVNHYDGQTHGIEPGYPVFPPQMTADDGDHYMIGIFPTAGASFS